MDIGKLDSIMRPEDDVREGDTVKVLDEGAMIKFNEGKPNEAIKLQVSFEVPSKEVKKLSLNNTTMKAFKEAWGKDTSKWLGKQAVVSISLQNVNGNMKKVIYLFPK